MVAVNSCLRPLTDVFGFGPSFVLCHVWHDVEKGQNTLRVRKTCSKDVNQLCSRGPVVFARSSEAQVLKEVHFLHPVRNTLGNIAQKMCPSPHFTFPKTTRFWNGCPFVLSQKNL